MLWRLKGKQQIQLHCINKRRLIASIHGNPYTQIEFINLLLKTQFYRQQNLSFSCVLMSEDKFDYSIVATHLQINISFRNNLFKFYFMVYDGWRMVNDEYFGPNI